MTCSVLPVKSEIRAKEIQYNELRTQNVPVVPDRRFFLQMEIETKQRKIAFQDKKIEEVEEEIARLRSQIREERRAFRTRVDQFKDKVLSFAIGSQDHKQFYAECEKEVQEMRDLKKKLEEKQQIDSFTFETEDEEPIGSTEGPEAAPVAEQNLPQLMQNLANFQDGSQ